ncbi:hypothetical protein LDENG_00136570 [Lucifuga dentata]|nr:hypothetical protein LDENG_00136570 [Lucifuga dentata]
MQYVHVLKKRSLETEVEPWNYRQKRVRFGAELRTSDCPMETSLSLNGANQQQEQQVSAVRPGPSLLCCNRCLGGEPGHINHILGH